MKRILFYAYILAVFSAIFLGLSSCKTENDEERLIGKWNKRETQVSIELKDELVGDNQLLFQSQVDFLKKLNKHTVDTIKKLLDHTFVGFTCQTLDELQMHLMVGPLGAMDFNGTYFYLDGEPFVIQLDDVPNEMQESLAPFGGAEGIPFAMTMLDENHMSIFYPPRIIEFFIVRMIGSEKMRDAYIEKTYPHLKMTDILRPQYERAYDQYVPNIKTVDVGYKLVRE